MLASIICAAVIGIILGSNFTVFSLAPAILLSAAAALAASFANDADFHVVIFAMLAMVTSLQVGYLAGGIAAACGKAPRSVWKSSRYF
jgi:uncharacterized membrane protein